MGQIPALAISTGAIAALAAYVFLGHLTALPVAATFIAWATVSRCGGGEAGLARAVTQLIFGAVIAWLALLLATLLPLRLTLGDPLWTALCIGVTLFVLVMASSHPALSDISTSLIGYAAVIGHALLATKLDSLTAAGLANPLISVTVSMLIGAALAYVSERIAGLLRAN